MDFIWNRFILVILAFFLIGSIPVFCQQSHNISGTVTDHETHAPLAGTTIVLKETIIGTSADQNGRFELYTKLNFPLTIEISFLGYQSQSIILKEQDQDLQIELIPDILNIEEMVITASRIPERVFKSPVAIEKLDLKDIHQSASGFYDAVENIKGVQMTTLSMGFKVPNTRGFANTTNSRFLQMVDGVDTQAPGLGVSIANTIGPTELDILSVEIVPGASSALYGMNALNGISNAITKSPFLFQGLSFYQKMGVNHVDSKDYRPQLFTESSVRYAKVLNQFLAIKINAGYINGTDWVANDLRDLNPDANKSVNLTGDDNPASDPINSYGNERSNRRNLKLADGKEYEVRRTGYNEKDIVTNDYGINNLKADAGIYYRPGEKNEVSYTYHVGSSDAVYQRGNRIRLDNYMIQQHKIEWVGSHFSLKSYMTIENTTKSYNLRPMGEVLDRDFKSDNDWFTQYSGKFNELYHSGVPVSESHRLARETADAGRYTPGTPEFEAKLKELSLINNWDHGAQLLMNHMFWHTEGQYDFRDKIKFIDLLIGGDYRNYFIHPEGNSFINPDENHPEDIMTYEKYGGFIQATKRLLHDQLKLIGSLRIDRCQYFDPKINPRIAAVYTIKENHTFRASFQNGFRFPTLFEGFSTVNNGGVIRYGGLRIMTEKQQLFENSYTRTSVDAFVAANTSDVNNAGKTREQAIIDNQSILVRNNYTYLEPEEINAIEFGYRARLLDQKIFIDADVYLNQYRNFIDQIEISVPQSEIGTLDANGNDVTIFEVDDRTKNTVYRMWTNSKSIYYNYGYSFGITYNAFKDYNFGGNVSYAKLDMIDSRDSGLETPFNTPEWIVNLSFGNRQVFKNVGFNVTWRWQDSFEWKATLANGVIPAYSTIDAQVNFSVPKLHVNTKLGGTNILNNRYRQYEGGPTIGAFYYFAVTIDGLLTK